MKDIREISATEAFLRRQERSIRAEKRVSALVFIPVFIIVLSLLVTAFLLIEREVNCSQNLLKGKEVSDTDAGVKSQRAEAKPSAVRDGKIDINSADEELLDSLPEIGEVRAKAIVDARTQMGGFRSVEDLLNVEGIGEKVLEKIKDLVFVE